MSNRRYTCMETCGQEQHCGNTYCSAHPRYIPPSPKDERTARKLARRRFNALHPKKKVYNPMG